MTLKQFLSCFLFLTFSLFKHLCFGTYFYAQQCTMLNCLFLLLLAILLVIWPTSFIPSSTKKFRFKLASLLKVAIIEKWKTMIQHSSPMTQPTKLVSCVFHHGLAKISCFKGEEESPYWVFLFSLFLLLTMGLIL